MKSTKFLAALLAVMMIFGTFAASAAGFTDITLESNPEAYKNALLLNQMGVVKGDENGNANLDKPVTRAEMAAFIFRLGTAYTDIVGGVNSTTFEDLEADGWYISNVVWCYEQGIIAGRDPESKIFDPKADVSYDEAIKMVVTLLGYKGLSYPLGYYLKFLDLLKAADTTLAKVLPEYKGDVAGTRNPISRGEVISMLNVAFKAPMADEKGKASEYTLQNSVWANSDTSIKEYYAVVVANEKKALPGFSATAAAGKVDLAVYTTDSNGVKSLGTEVIADQAAAADYGLAADVEIGTYFTYYKMGTADEVKAGNGDIVKELTTTATSAVIEDASYSETVKKVSDVDTKFVTINGKEMKSADADKIDYVATYSATNAVPVFAAPASAVDADSFWKAIDAGQDLYVVAYDLFADGSIDWFDWTVKEIGLVGDDTKVESATANNATTFKKFDTTKPVASTDKIANVKANTTSETFKYTLIDNKASAVKDNIVTFYILGGKIVVDEIVTPFKGIVTKVVNGTTFTVKKEDDTKVELTVASGTAPIKNIAFSTGLDTALKATASANFIVYGSKIVAVYGDTAPQTAHTYAGSSVALFYGLAAREVALTSGYEFDGTNYVLKYTAKDSYYAWVAYESDPSTLVKVPVYNIDGITDFSRYFVRKTGVTALNYAEALTDADKALNAKIGTILADGTALVVLEKDTTTDSATKDMYKISKINAAVAAAQPSADTKEFIIADAAYIAQNALTGFYEVYDSYNKVIATLGCDSKSVIFNLSALRHVKEGSNEPNDVLKADSGKKYNYTASKLSTFGAITQNTAYEIFGELVVEAPKAYTNANDNLVANVKSVVLRKAVVLKNTSKLSAGQLIATSVDTTKAPYNYMILKSVDSIEIDGLKGIITFTVYNPATGTTQALVLETTADKAENAYSTADTAAKKLTALIGKVVSYDSTNGWTGKTVAEAIDDLKVVEYDTNTAASATAKENTKLEGYEVSIDASKANIVAGDGSYYYLVAEVSGARRYFKLADNAVISDLTKAASAPVNGVYSSKDITKVAVENDKGEYALDGTYTFAINGASEVVFGYKA
ncbi:MAG: hypothetical protein E7665_01995 [Ruminococcaceae bacterium]|nr:hypothetical protein [Oscillospiraceae bacterium]